MSDKNVKVLQEFMLAWLKSKCIYLREKAGCVSFTASCLKTTWSQQTKISLGHVDHKNRECEDEFGTVYFYSTAITCKDAQVGKSNFALVIQFSDVGTWSLTTGTSAFDFCRTVSHNSWGITKEHQTQFSSPKCTQLLLALSKNRTEILTYCRSSN